MSQAGPSCGAGEHCGAFGVAPLQPCPGERCIKLGCIQRRAALRRIVPHDFAWGLVSALTVSYVRFIGSLSIGSWQGDWL